MGVLFAAKSHEGIRFAKFGSAVPDGAEMLGQFLANFSVLGSCGELC